MGDPIDIVVDGLLSVYDTLGNDTGLGADGDGSSIVVSPNSETNSVVPNPKSKYIYNNIDNVQLDGNINVYFTKEIESLVYEKKGKDGKPNGIKTSDGKRPYSAFNKYSLMNFKGTPFGAKASGGISLSEFNIIDPVTLENPTVTKIVEFTKDQVDNLGYRFDYSDFALAKYFNKIPNNQMLTLRRFPFPTGDDIISPKELGPDGKSFVDIASPDIARAITWMGDAPGNNINEILGFEIGYEWKEIESSIQTINTSDSGGSGKLGKLINGSSIAKAAIGAGQGKNAAQIKSREAEGSYDATKETYPNHVFGPLNIIKKILQREQGLNFKHEFTLKFEYELRSIGGANPKVMMMDQLSNILALTYNNAPFWGGSARWIGDGTVAKPLGDMSKLASGDISGFMGSIMSDLKGMLGGALDSLESAKEFAGKSVKNFLGGALMDMVNTPQGGQTVAAFLSGDPTGQWHLTVGNPLNPMAMIGNLACTDTKISFDGPLGIQDFPEKLIVEISLKPGRPRDKSDIESMFNCGKGRFYLQPKDGVDINASVDVDSYGRSVGNANTVKEFRKITNG